MNLNRLAAAVALGAALLTGGLQAAEPAIIPLPVEIKTTEGKSIPINQTTFVSADAACADIVTYVLQAIPSHNNPAMNERSSEIALKVDANLDTNDEGYTLKAHGTRIEITGKTPAGVFYGVQTLRELLPPEALAADRSKGAQYSIPEVDIKDQPRFKWRGLMMDTARHFFNKDEVKKFIDILALHKMNTFHWHLVDDQGWRIEIKKYPKLTEIGAWRKDIGFGLKKEDSTAYGPDGRYGGFYTQDEIREVVAYAKARFITIVPEIEMPGHANAALAAYPEFSCNGKQRDTNLAAGVFPSIYCASSPQTKAFLEDVLTEVMDLFPSQFIHIGGDEVPKSPWKACPKCQAYIKEHGLKNEDELQSDFVHHFDKFLASKGRRLIGWDEILEGGLAPGATVMSWRGVGGGTTAARANHDVVMTPTSHMYLDYYQDRANTQPRGIGGYVPLTKVYEFEPVPTGLSPEQSKHILGVQGNLWAEYFPNYKHVEYMALPRGAAVAEVGWSPADKRDWDSFASRMKEQMKRYDALDMNYYHKALETQLQVGGWEKKQMTEEFKPRQWDVTKSITKAGTLEFTFQYTGGAQRADMKNVALLEDGKEIATDAHEGQSGAADKNNVYTLKLPQLKAGAKYVLKADMRADGGTDSNGKIYLKIQ